MGPALVVVIPTHAAPVAAGLEDREEVAVGALGDLLAADPRLGEERR
jgi:hypothetical protein